MWRLAADENFNGRIFRGVARRTPDVDLVRVQDTEIEGADDPKVLDWAAAEGRIVLTHDCSTMVGYAWDRVRAEKPMPGLIAVPLDAPIGRVVEDLILMIEADSMENLAQQVFFLPL